MLIAQVDPVGTGLIRRRTRPCDTSRTRPPVGPPRRVTQSVSGARLGCRLGRPAMRDDARQTGPPDEVLASVRTVADRIGGDAASPADYIMSALHSMWVLVCGRPHGHSIRGLVAVAGHFIEAAKAVAHERDQTALLVIGRIGKGLSLLRAGEFKSAAKTLAKAGVLNTEAEVLGLAARCWEVYTLALAREHRSATTRLRQARAALKQVKEPGRCLPGFLRLAEALLQYEEGRFQTSLDTLSASLHAFHSPHVTTLLDFPGFEAEALLVRAKNLRETGRYAEALALVEQSNDIREDLDDRLGEAWGYIERGRLHRFRGAYDRALVDLRKADRCLRSTDFSDWKARIADQRGDVFRAMSRLREAGACMSDAAALAGHSKSRYLQGHLVNSRARLLEDRGDFESALALIDKQDVVWRGKKEFGRHLYLKGSIHRRLGNLAIAEKLLKSACDHFHRYGMRTHEVLAFDRLASLCLDDTRRLEAARKKAACTCWANALRVARATDVKHLVLRLQEHAAVLTATDLIDVIAATIDEKHAVETELVDEQERFRAAAHWHRVERACLKHWFVEIVARQVDRPQDFPTALLAYLRDFCDVLMGPPWREQPHRHAPIGPADDVDVCELCRTCRDVVASLLGIKLTVSTARKRACLRVNQAYLFLAIKAVMCGAVTAFGTRRFKLGVHVRRNSRLPYCLRFTLEHPKPVHFKEAPRLVAVESLLTESPPSPFIAKGYTGHFSLLDFLVHIALLGRLEFDVGADTIVIELPEPDSSG